MTTTPLEALDHATEQVRSVHEAAERAASQIEADAEQMRLGSGGEHETLMVGLADALIERTENIRSDCNSLSKLLDRAAGLVRTEEGQATPEATPTEPAPAAKEKSGPSSAKPGKTASKAKEVKAAKATEAEPKPSESTSKPTARPPKRPRGAPKALRPSASGGKPSAVPGAVGGSRSTPPPPSAAQTEPAPTPKPFAEPSVEPAVEQEPPAEAPKPEAGLSRITRRLLRRDREPPADGQADAPPERSGHSEGVRLIATQMAIAGSSRQEIERRLQSQFGVSDADNALDEIFGSRNSSVGG